MQIRAIPDSQVRATAVFKLPMACSDQANMPTSRPSKERKRFLTTPRLKNMDARYMGWRHKRKGPAQVYMHICHIYNKSSSGTGRNEFVLFQAGDERSPVHRSTYPHADSSYMYAVPHGAHGVVDPEQESR